MATPSRAMPPRGAGDDPSYHTKVELASRGAECVGAAGNLARLVVKGASSSALKSTLGAFAEYEKTVESTDQMLHKISQGVTDLNDALNEVSISLRGGSSSVRTISLSSEPERPPKS